MFNLHLIAPSHIPIDLGGILPETLAWLSETAAARQLIRQGNRTLELGELFRVIKIGRDDDFIRFGDVSNHCTSIGAGMNWGTIEVLGNVGMHAGARMRGGTLRIEGSTGNWLGAEMKGGEIEVYGDVGHQAGAAYRGSRRGMWGGEIHIRGNAGDELGLLMRRGLIRVRGSCGDFTAASMIAGTITVKGKLGRYPGAGMKRGTIITSESISELPPGLVHSCDYSPEYFKMMTEEDSEFEQSFALYCKSVRCYRGDLMTGGRGELWHVLR
ncbi:hypothetical protein BH11PLA2_BH11PLA2_34790 [soil metagenome]